MTIRALRYENHKALQFFLCFYSRSLCFTFLVVNFMINTLFLLICHMLKFVPYISYKLNRKSTFIYAHWPRSVISTPNTRHLSTRLRFLQHIPNRANGTIILSFHSYSSMDQITLGKIEKKVRQLLILFTVRNNHLYRCFFNYNKMELYST